MALIVLFPPASRVLNFSEISQSLFELLGLGIAVMQDNEPVVAEEFEQADEEFADGTVYIELPELEEDEGEPVVSVLAAPRLDREEDFQKFIDEIIEQDPSLAKALNENARDIYLTCEDTPAGLDALSALAYVLASESECGLLLRTSQEEEDTVWFPDAEEFADFAFGEDDEEDNEDE